MVNLDRKNCNRATLQPRWPGERISAVRSNFSTATLMSILGFDFPKLGSCGETVDVEGLSPRIATVVIVRRGTFLTKLNKNHDNCMENKKSSNWNGVAAVFCPTFFS